MPKFFQRVQAGTPSYAAGGFNVVVAEAERLVSAMVQMNPETKLASTAQSAIRVTLRGNTAVVQLFRSAGGAEAWAELPAAFDLAAADFIVTGTYI